MNILPGEPVPPGFEDEVNRVAAIQKSIEHNTKPLIGIEYTLELREDERHEPGYLCTLCDKRGDPRTIISHWLSFNHRMKYLEKHFPTAVREFNSIRYKPNSHVIVNQIVQNLTKAIEQHHGRGRVVVYNADDFRRQKTKILQDLNNKFHFDERNGPDFLNCIDRSLWERVNPGAATIMKAPLPTIQVTIKNKREHGSGEGLDEISSESENESNAKKSKIQHSDKEKSGNGTDKKLPTPKELSLQASHIAQERYKWEKYRCMLEIQLKQMTESQREYEVNPEKHPLYPGEWKKFWNQRYKELQSTGKVDPNKYDYKPEWIAFWTKRMKTLFDEDVENRKKELKVKLGLPEHAEEKVDQLRERYRVQVSGRGNIKSDSNDAEVIDISDDDNSSSHGRNSRRSRSPRRSRSRRSYSSSISPARERSYGRTRRSRSKSPSIDYFERPRGRAHRHPQMERDYLPHARGHYAPSAPYGGGSYRVLDSHQMPKYMHSPSAHSAAAAAATALQNAENSQREEPPEDEGPLTVVSVLRLVIALEEHLGSLGHKVVDMLGKALALEKVKANSSDDLLLNEDHVVFFETIKEKLKGLLIADVIEDAQKIRAVKKAIRNIATVIYQVANSAKAKTTNNNDQDHNLGSNANSTNGRGNNGSNDASSQSGTELPFDRQLIVSKLAAALVIQGREDITSDQMDLLIQMFLLMVKLNKARLDSEGKPIRMRDIGNDLGLPIPESTKKRTSEQLDGTDYPNAVGEDDEASRSNASFDPFEKDFSKKQDANATGNASMLESLTDSDLQTLLQNFKHLSHEEQHHLIVHLKKLETADPQRVEKLRKYVNLADVAADTSSNNNDDAASTSKRSSNAARNLEDSPPGTSNRRSGYSDDEDAAASIGTRRQVPLQKINLTHDDEDDDDDYNFEEVFKAASKNVKGISEDRSSSRHDHSNSSSHAKSKDAVVPGSSSPSALTFKSSSFNVNLSDTQNLIANLMGSIQQSNAAGSSGKSVPVGNTIPSIQNRETQMKTQPAKPQGGQVGGVTSVNMPQQVGMTTQPIVPQQPYFQQSGAGYPGGYDQQNMAGYNYMAAGGYNNPTAGYGAPQAYGQNWNGMNPQQQWQNYGVPNMQQPQPHGYNMYGPSGN